MNISIIIITHNNFTNKDGCLESVILALNNQININSEIIIVDNASDAVNVKFLKKLGKTYPNISILYNDNNNISSGRNIGAKNANNELISFIDDDILLYEKDTLEHMIKKAENREYGFSAVRLWTIEGWYQNNKDTLNKKILQNANDYGIQTSNPDPEVRRKENNRHLVRTYIGNLGFISKSALIDVGYWDECYEGYGVEDDAMVFKLYMKYGKPVILEDICVVHIWHEIAEEDYNRLYENKKIYDNLLKANRIKNFHIGRVLYNEGNEVEL